MPFADKIRRNFYTAAVGAALLLFASGLLAASGDTVKAASEGISLCINIIIPSLFPFFILSSLLVELGFATLLGRVMHRVMQPLFRVPGTCASALALGLIGGYPVGARTALMLYEKQLCTKTEAERLLAFCNNSGPAFILGTVGAAVFDDARIGLFLYLTHVAASLTVGLLFRFYKRKENGGERKSGSIGFSAVRFTPALVVSVQRSSVAMVGICGFVILFSATIRLLYVFGIIPAFADFLAFLFSPLSLSPSDFEGLLSGILEVTSGLWTLRGAESAFTIRLSMAAFMLGWAGVSVHFQVISFIGKSRLSLAPYIIGKLLHACISAIYAVAAVRLLGNAEPVAAYLARQVEAVMELNFFDSLRLSLGSCGLLLLLFLPLLVLPAVKKIWHSLK